MNIEEYCLRLADLSLNHADNALAILRYCELHDLGEKQTAGYLAGVISKNGLGSPHSTRLGQRLVKTGHVLKVGVHFRLKAASRAIVDDMVKDVAVKMPPEVNDNAYLPAELWNGSRGYIEVVGRQLNGCYDSAFYDAASVMLRRIAETLVIECYEHLGRANEIQDSDGNYFMLSKLIIASTSSTGLSLGRDGKKGLKDIKTHGDRSAHNRRYTATKSDLDNIQSHVRVAVQELIAIAGFKTA